MYEKPRVNVKVEPRSTLKRVFDTETSYSWSSLYSNLKVAFREQFREFNIYDVTVAKTSLKIASSSFSS